MVAAYSGPLLAADGTTTLVTADWRDPGAVLGDPGLRRLIDLAHPAGVLMTTLPGFVPDEGDPRGLVARYMEGAWWLATWKRWRRAAIWRCRTEPTT
jgi:hypothetical protein